MELSNAIQNEIGRNYEDYIALKPLSQAAQDKLDRKFRLEFNYNSNHLEGNTLTYSDTELLLIFEKVEGQHELRELDEMKAHDVALKMIENEALDTERPLTENFIRMLNETLLVKPYWKDAVTVENMHSRKEIVPGRYKLTPNSVRLGSGDIFHYSSPDDVPIEMNDLVVWYNTNSGVMHPVALAATLHYRFVRIHPFDDGNGRTARLLMNYVLIR